MKGQFGLQCTLLYLMKLEGKYTATYEILNHRLKTFLKALDEMNSGYIPISLISSSQLKQMLNEVTESEHINPDYVLIFKNLYSYYDKKMLTFGFCF